MNPEHHDKSFAATFLAVIAFLGGLTLTLIGISHFVGKAELADKGGPSNIEERIKPVAQVITDPNALAAFTPAPAAAAGPHTPRTGAQIVDSVCSACHGAGVLGAPKIGDKAEWSKRKAAGMAALMNSATHGKNQMPARGGDASLSDDEVKSAIEEMLKRTGA